MLQLVTSLGSAIRWGLFKGEEGLVRRARLVRALTEERYADLVSQIELVEPQAWLLLETVLKLRDHGLGVHLCEDGAERAHLVRGRLNVRRGCGCGLWLGAERAHCLSVLQAHCPKVTGSKIGVRALREVDILEAGLVALHGNRHALHLCASPLG